MVIAPACHSVDPGFESGPGTLGVPSLSNSDEETLRGLHILVHIQCDVIREYCKSPPKNINNKKDSGEGIQGRRRFKIRIQGMEYELEIQGKSQLIVEDSWYRFQNSG